MTIDGYGALLTHAHMLRKALWAYRAERGEWPREAEARDNPVDAEYMGAWDEVPDTLPITREVLDFAAKARLAYDPEIFQVLLGKPSVTYLYVRFRFAEATPIHLHGVRVVEGVMELPLDGGQDWVVEVQRFDAPTLAAMTAKVGDRSTDLDDVLDHWGMIRIYPNEGRRVVWVSTDTLACTIHFSGEEVTQAGCTPIPGRASTPPAPEPAPTRRTASGTQNIPGVKSHYDDDYTGLDYDWDDYNPD